MRRLLARWWMLVLLWPVLILATGYQLEELAATVRSFYGDKAEQRVRAWRQVISDGHALSETEQLHTVNDFFNQMQFVDDIDVWGQKDYWATPVEFLGAAAGDCDDFSIAKYFSLIELGVSDEKMRLVYVKSLTYNQFHMVVAYYQTPSSVPIILDNINPTILPATQRDDLVPIYSFNGQHLWLMKEKGRGQLAGKSSRLKLWTDLQQRWRLNKLKKPIKNFDA
ncbi:MULTISPECIES: transglutaminase-like cysteine peptidase [unclassified Agarivorans]|uniref:transglutaminase-like cysteine peptidase n=1 Tax=unclassified Agarivorans TaxID=2636026 RepID=UPI0026E2539E|nr:MULTISPECIES: transglutaminase-like cysteine peptidase [unclassified Agarivorans]MDO6687930.1 transglutaminase-like cysteine peptidase [Agarivorans sp. 3_MG-2023]MDO6717552.1 transglutaminase-like cysteine peptidase [Agarivorans sp. 2_MG-2023]MDO6764465.1 transglutaminase-like cysteine peptidase [Agarivorans sp. 1_MG-2023]